VSDIVDGCVMAAQHDYSDPINLGTGHLYTVTDVVDMICKVMNWKPERFDFDESKPSGALSRALDNSRAKEVLGWEPKVTLEEGLSKTIEWYLKTHTYTGKILDSALLEHSKNT
jgi:nucleoside-diphosphate-sugar epimerase